MNFTDLTAKQIEAFSKVESMNIFAAKVCATVRQNGYFSAKQAAIINEAIDRNVTPDDVDGILNDYFLPSGQDIHEANRASMMRQLPSSMR